MINARRFEMDISIKNVIGTPVVIVVLIIVICVIAVFFIKHK
jgi:hypothetical protein